METAFNHRRRFTVEEYHRMAGAAIFGDWERVELIEGEIHTMSPIGKRHAGTVDYVSGAFSARLRGRAIVRVQGPVLIGDQSEPEPDIALLRPRADYYRSKHPEAADILLIVEVMDTSATYDRQVKLGLYALAAIPEVWLIDLNGERVEVYRQPSGDVYTVIQIGLRGQKVAPGAFPDLELGVDDILG